MRYYVSRVTVTADSEGTETEARDLRGFDTIDEAKSRYHTDLAKYINVDGTVSTMDMIFDTYANKIMAEYWHKAEEPEPETTDSTDTTEA